MENTENPAEDQLDQFGLGPEDAAHDDEGKARKAGHESEGDSSVNRFGMGPEDLERSEGV